MKRYTIIVEKAQDTYSAYVPDLPACITTGKMVDEVMENMEEALSLYLDTMKELGISILEPSVQVDVVADHNDTYTIEVSV